MLASQEQAGCCADGANLKVKHSGSGRFSSSSNFDVAEDLLDTAEAAAGWQAAMHCIDLVVDPA